ncbi:hypothetical protein CDAR_461391 [Caerostris darwini]|uniref:Uncharacterized protein n=1 Tax=Caerostris darwini TaxID=1538125 RepID=A0AAV4NGQ9_9ARAC|nr:hypothetical protein CDAR_461391 [Caerostris darwini]
MSIPGYPLGHDILKGYSSVEINLRDDKKPLKIWALAAFQILPVSLYKNLTPDCKSISTKSRRHLEENFHFMAAGFQKFLNEEIIDPSN